MRELSKTELELKAKLKSWGRLNFEDEQIIKIVKPKLLLEFIREGTADSLHFYYKVQTSFVKRLEVNGDKLLSTIKEENNIGEIFKPKRSASLTPLIEVKTKVTFTGNWDI